MCINFFFFISTVRYACVYHSFIYSSCSVLAYLVHKFTDFDYLFDILYRSLLLECEGDEVFPWEQEQLRDEDWSEDPICRYETTYFMYWPSDMHAV